MTIQLLLFFLLSGMNATQAAFGTYCTQSDRCSTTGRDVAQARYDFTRIYHLELATDTHVKMLQDLEHQSDSCSFMGHAREPGQKLTIMVSASKVADVDDLLHTYNITHRILNYDFQELIDANYKDVAPVDTSPTNFNWHRYFHLENIYAWMEHLAAEYPDIVTMLDMGNSAQGRPIKGVRISHPTKATNRSSIFVESGIHAREWIAPATATYFINELVRSTDPHVQQIAREHNWIIFPSVNPDGYIYTFTGDRMWRKNRVLFGICRGVDLNRNFPLHWNTTGASGDPCRYDYSGPAAGSEVETQRIMKFVEDHKDIDRIRSYIALHSYSQLIMFPYGSTPEHVDNYNDLQEIGQLAAKRIEATTGRIYKSGSLYETIYPSSGGSKDWAYGQLKIPITFTFELRGPPDSESLFILPAAEIEPTAREAFAAFLVIVEEAAKRGYYN